MRLSAAGLFMKSSDGCWPNSALYSLVLSLLVSLNLAGCSQHEGVPTSEEAASPDQHLPFDGASDKGGIFPTDSLIPAAIPAGTSVAVRLRKSLSSATCRPGDSFEAVLDEPIIVRGKIIAPSGSNVTGKVLDARAAGELQESGYLRLGLTAVSLNGRSLPIQTSSIFVKRSSHRQQNPTTLAGARISETSSSGASTVGASIEPVSTGGLVGSGQRSLIGASTRTAVGIVVDHATENTENKDVGVSAERRLTFRLAQPLPLRM
jgi:hypothetical protein